MFGSPWAGAWSSASPLLRQCHPLQRQSLVFYRKVFDSWLQCQGSPSKWPAFLDREPCSPTRDAPHCIIELRPNDLASPRTPRRTEDFSPNLERTGCAGARLSLHTYLKEELYGARNREVVQQPKSFGFNQPDDGGKDVFALVSAIERAGMHGLN
jgi:hypothetical protein